MAVTLYDFTVAPFLQTLSAMSGVLDRALAHCEETGADAEALAGVRLAPDMLPLAFQVQSMAEHSAGAMRAARDGLYVPGAFVETPFAGMQARVAEARAELVALRPDEVDDLEGKAVALRTRLSPNDLVFPAPSFLISISLPNFYFHATTAYAILRSQGVPLGKRDFLGGAFSLARVQPRDA